MSKALPVKRGKPETAQAAKKALQIAKRAIALAEELRDENLRLRERESEAVKIIQGLLSELERAEQRHLILKLRPKAQRFLAARKAARIRKSQQRERTEDRVWAALKSEIQAGTSERAILKRISHDLKLTPQYVGRIVRRRKVESQRR